MKRQQHFLPLFVGDFLASTATWEGEERALYLLLLAYQWSSGPLPTDAKKLGRMTQYDAKTFSGLWRTVGQKFVEQGGGLVNPRLEEHRARAAEISNRRAEAGAKGGANKQAKTKQTTNNGVAIATVLLPHPIQSNSEDLRSSGVPPSVAVAPEPPTRPNSDPRKALWDLGVSLLGDEGRSLIGQAIKRVGESKVAAVLGGMAAKPPADTVPYFIRATQERGFVM